MTNTQLLQALYDDMQTVKKHVVSLDNRVSSLEVKMDLRKNGRIAEKIDAEG